MIESCIHSFTHEISETIYDNVTFSPVKFQPHSHPLLHIKSCKYSQWTGNQSHHLGDWLVPTSNPCTGQTLPGLQRTEPPSWLDLKLSFHNLWNKYGYSKNPTGAVWSWSILFTQSCLSEYLRSLWHMKNPKIFKMDSVPDSLPCQLVASHQ